MEKRITSMRKRTRDMEKRMTDMMRVWSQRKGEKTRLFWRRRWSGEGRKQYFFGGEDGEGEEEERTEEKVHYIPLWGTG